MHPEVLAAQPLRLNMVGYAAYPTLGNFLAKISQA